MIEGKEQIDKVLDQFETEKASLPEWKVYMRPSILDMHIDEIRKKTPQELAEASFEIRRYVLNIKRLQNRLSAWKQWGNAKLEEIAASNLINISPEYGWNGRMLLARNSGENCKLMNQFIRKISMELESLNHIPENIEMIAKSVESMRFVNYKKEQL